VKYILTGIVVALQFLTTVPPLLRRTVTPNELGRAVAFFPLVGLLIGLILFGLHRLLNAALPSAILAAILLGVWILCSGALHFDGFVDAVDGLLGGRTPEDRMRIMRDERVGAFALAGGGTLLLLKFAALGVVGVAPVALIAAPLLGRWVMSAAIVLFPYARAEGLGRTMKDSAGWPQAVGASAISVAALGVLAPSAGLAATGAAVVAVGVSVWLLIRFTLARIPGLTGDIYGALCEVGETLCLVTLAAHW
jgi:adenosylcobinamide-GDP ribazoletransferase